MGPRLKVALIVAALCVPVAVSVVIYVRGGSSDTPARDVPQIKTTTTESSGGLHSSQQEPAIRDSTFILKPVTDFSYTRRTDGDYRQVQIKHKGDTRAVGELVVNSTATGGLGELVATQTGGYNPDAVRPPMVSSLRIAGATGALLVTDLGDGTIRVTGIAWHDHKSFLLSFLGASGEQTSLETMVKEHAAALTFA